MIKKLSELYIRERNTITVIVVIVLALLCVGRRLGGWASTPGPPYQCDYKGSCPFDMPYLLLLELEGSSFSCNYPHCLYLGSGVRTPQYSLSTLWRTTAALPRCVANIHALPVKVGSCIRAGLSLSSRSIAFYFLTQVSCHLVLQSSVTLPWDSCLGYVMMIHYHIEHILTLLTCHNYWEDSITQESRQGQGSQAPPVAMPVPWWLGNLLHIQSDLWTYFYTFFPIVWTLQKNCCLYLRFS